MSEIYEINKKIVKIVRLQEERHRDENDMFVGWDGIRIELDDESLLEFKIDNFDQCCENFGYHIDENIDLLKYEGSLVKKVVVYEKENAKPEYDEKYLSKDYECDYEINVIIHTDKGYFKVILYNQHNGYYRHDVSIQIMDECKIIGI
jgi:hypothetical protein